MDEIKKKNGFGPILANFKINYRIPLKYPDKVYASARVKKEGIGNSSFIIEYLMTSEKNAEAVVADGESVIVIVNYRDGSKMKIDDEMRRVFEVCHGCRKCFNLCDIFPKLIDLIDNSKNVFYYFSTAN